MKTINTIEKIETYNTMTIDNVSIAINNTDTNYCRVTVSFFGENKSFSDVVFLTKEQIDSWSDDDNVLYQIIAQKLNLTFNE
jgi:hypothetical protein